LKNILSSQVLLNLLGDFNETWYKERSHYVDMHIIRGGLSNGTVNPLHCREKNMFTSRSTTCFRCIFSVLLVFPAFKWKYILLRTGRELSDYYILEVYFVVIFTLNV
jgi:hypothetical protein